MVNAFDIAREMARLVDACKSGDELAAEMRRKFPTATADDYRRAKIIGIDRLEMLEEERQAATRDLADLWFGGAPKEAIDAAIRSNRYNCCQVPTPCSRSPIRRRADHVRRDGLQRCGGLGCAGTRNARHHRRSMPGRRVGLA